MRIGQLHPFVADRVVGVAVDRSNVDPKLPDHFVRKQFLAVQYRYRNHLVQQGLLRHSHIKQQKLGEFNF